MLKLEQISKVGGTFSTLMYPMCASSEMHVFSLKGKWSKLDTTHIELGSKKFFCQ